MKQIVKQILLVFLLCVLFVQHTNTQPINHQALSGLYEIWQDEIDVFVVTSKKNILFEADNQAQCISYALDNNTKYKIMN